MVDPAVQELINRYWWFLPSAFIIGILVIILEKKIDEYKRKKRIEKKK